jgi:DNA polymerase (family 10)/putative hydrolase
MKRWKKYKDFLQKGDWHVHTNYTNGMASVLEYLEKAIENKLDLIAFTEHVRKKMNYKFIDLISEIYSLKDKFDIQILIGCEAKVLDLEGNLDVSDEILKNCEIVLGTFHEFEFKQKEFYLIALKNMLKNPEVDIWAHPTLFAKKNNFSLNRDEIQEIGELCLKNDVLIEKNLKHNVPDLEFLNIVTSMGCSIVLGSDAHNTNELLNLKTS